MPADELARVTRLRRRVGAKSNVAVVRRALRLLEEATDRAHLRREYEKASIAVRRPLEQDLAELDHLAGEGIED